MSLLITRALHQTKFRVGAGNYTFTTRFDRLARCENDPREFNVVIDDSHRFVTSFYTFRSIRSSDFYLFVNYFPPYFCSLVIVLVIFR